MHKHLILLILIIGSAMLSITIATHDVAPHPHHDQISNHSIRSQTPDGVSSFSIDFPTIGHNRIDQEILQTTHSHRAHYRSQYKELNVNSGSYHQTYEIMLDNTEYMLILFRFEFSYDSQQSSFSYHTLLFDKHTSLSIDSTTLLASGNTPETLENVLHETYSGSSQIDTHAFHLDNQGIAFYPSVSPSLSLQPTRLSFEKYRWLFDLGSIYQILAPSLSHSRYHTPVDCSVSKCVALTFDDGPGPHTQTLLDYLAQYNVPATFFLLGSSVQRYPSLTTDIALAGHEIGNHSRDHPDLTKLDQQEILKQIQWTDDQIYRHTGQHTNLLRPPYGAYDDKLLSLTDKAILLWSVDPLDWKMRKTDTVARRMSQARPGDIILSHDIRPTTVAAIPTVIQNLRNQGYHFVTVSQLLGSVESGVVYRQQP